MDCSFLKGVVSLLQRFLQTSFFYELVCVIQFVCTHRRNNETTSFNKEKSISLVSHIVKYMGSFISF